MNFGEFLTFRKMITPTIIQIIYLVSLAANALAAIGVLIAGMTRGFAGFLGGALGAVIILAVGSLLIRVYCELLILLFKIYDELKAIRTGTPPPDASMGFPVTPIMPVTPMPSTGGAPMPPPTMGA